MRGNIYVVHGLTDTVLAINRRDGEVTMLNSQEPLKPFPISRTEAASVLRNAHDAGLKYEIYEYQHE